MKLEFLLRKLSDFFSLTIHDIEDRVVLRGNNIEILLDGKTLKLRVSQGEFEIQEEQVEDFKFFSKTKHCTIKLKNGVMRIYSEEGSFRFFVRISGGNGCAKGLSPM